MAYSANGITILETSEYFYMYDLILDLKRENKKLKDTIKEMIE